MDKYMRQFIRDTWRVFLTAYAQVFFIAAQTKFIQNDQVLFVGMAAFAISTCWLHNVSSVIKTRVGKIGYVAGCTLGSMSSIYLYNLIGW